MKSISDVVQNHGGHFEYVTKEGKVLKIKYLTLKVMSQFESKLQNQAIKDLAAQKGVIPEKILTELFKDLMKDIQSGKFAFGGDVCSDNLSTPKGIASLLALLCDVSDDEALETLLGEGEKFKEVFNAVVRASMSNPEEDEENSVSTDEKKS